MTKEKAMVICKQMNEIVYPEMMGLIYKIARGDMFLNMLKDIVNKFDLLFQLPKALEMDDGRDKEELALNIDELLSRVMKLLGRNRDDDTAVAMQIRNAMYAMDRILQITINYTSKMFSDDTVDKMFSDDTVYENNQEVTSDGQGVEESK